MFIKMQKLLHNSPGRREAAFITLCSFQYNTPELWLICGSIKGPWLLPELPHTLKYLYFLRSTCQPYLSQWCCRSLQLPLKGFSGEAHLMSSLSERIACPCLSTDSRIAFCLKEKFSRVPNQCLSYTLGNSIISFI